MTPSADRTHLAPHWRPLPHWSPGRALLACYLTFDDELAVHAAVERYQAPLRDVPELDLVPREWLHATVQGAWFVDALPPTAHLMLAGALGDVLAQLPAPEVSLSTPHIGAEGVYLPIRPVEAMLGIRAAVRAAIRRTLGLAQPYALPGQAGATYDPHVTFAYANAAYPSTEVGRRLADVEHPPTVLTVRGVTVLCVEPVMRTWRWTDAVHVPLASAAGPVRAIG